MIKILYVSPNVNHHQIPLAQELMNIVGDSNFRYATLMLDECGRINMGFPAYRFSWLIDIAQNVEEFNTWFMEADIVLCSVRDFHGMMLHRLQMNKLTFYFSERWFKAGIGKLRLLHPRFLYLWFAFRKLSSYSNFFYLAQGDYAAFDFNFLGLCKERCLRFGYFVDVDSHALTTSSTLSLNKEKINIIWCGRFLRWKRVDTLIKAFAIVSAKLENVHLVLVGDGPIKEALKKLASKLLRNGTYDFFPSQPMDMIRQLMHDADIYVLPSNGYEGWGAVLNEAMSESCAVIASVEAGAAKNMIRDKENGLLFASGKYKELARCIFYLLDEKQRVNIVNNALLDIKKIWSPAVAAKRLVEYVENGNCSSFELGPMTLIQ